MLERRKLFYTESEINELANAIEYTSGTVSDNIDYLFIPIRKSATYIDFMFCNIMGIAPRPSTSSLASLTYQDAPLSGDYKAAKVAGPRWRIVSSKSNVRVLFNGDSSNSGYSDNFYTNSGSANSANTYILPYQFKANGSQYINIGFLDYLCNEDETMYMKIQVGGHIGVYWNNNNYYHNRIVSKLSSYPIYYIPLSV